MLKGGRRIVAVRRKREHSPLETKLADYGGMGRNPLLNSEKSGKRKKLDPD